MNISFYLEIRFVASIDKTLPNDACVQMLWFILQSCLSNVQRIHPNALSEEEFWKFRCRLWKPHENMVALSR